MAHRIVRNTTACAATLLALTALAGCPRPPLPVQGALPVSAVPALLAGAGIHPAGALPPWLAQWVAADLAHGAIDARQARARVAALATLEPATALAPLPRPALRPGAHLLGAAPDLRAQVPTGACLQAWNGSGTGAWYRVDTLCRESRWYALSLRIRWGQVREGTGASGLPDGFYQSAGVYNAWRPDRSGTTAAAADVGFGWDRDWRLWRTYKNDCPGCFAWGDAAVDPARHPVVDVHVRIVKDGVQVVVVDAATQDLVAAQFFALFPALGLDPSGAGMGFYRFDSVAQHPPSTLRSGSALVQAGTHYATLYSAQFSTLWLPSYTSTAADPGRHLYPPGPCCSPVERATVAVLAEQPWYSSVITIAYPGPG